MDTLQAEASSPCLIGFTQTGRYLIVLPRHLHLLRRSQSLWRLVVLVWLAWALLWMPFVVRTVKGEVERVVTTAT